MRKMQHLDTGKVFFAGRMALVAALVFVLVKAFLLPQVAPVNLSAQSYLPIQDGAVPLPDAAAPDYSAITERNIFGQSPYAHYPQDGDTYDSADSAAQSVDEQLGVKLVGTLAGSATVSRAVIKDLKTGAIGLYKTGDSVGTARIERIDKDSIVLSDGGRTRRLGLDIANSRHTTTVKTTVDAAKSTRVAAGAVETPSSQYAALEAVLEKAVIEPYVVKDQVEGLKLTGLENVPEARNLGLKDGDVIRVVNGQVLAGKQQAFQIFKKAKGRELLEIEMERENNLRTISIPQQNR